MSLRTWWQRWLPTVKPLSSEASAPHKGTVELPQVLLAGTAHECALNTVLRVTEAGASLDWPAVQAWCLSLPQDLQATARVEAEKAWLLHLAHGLGPHYRVEQQGRVWLLSSLEPHVAKAARDFVQRSVQRIVRVLDGVAAPASDHMGADICVVLDDPTTYYQYVLQFYPDDAEVAASSGMFIAEGCAPHFVTVKDELHVLEPVWVHELTHACVSHLPLPLWLNEGLAVNTELRLSSSGMARHPAVKQHARHQKFWTPQRLQQFWSGHSFQNPEGDSNELSYDLARILVAHLSSDWPRFKQFACAAQAQDGGAAAALAHLPWSLGQVVALLLDRPDSADLEPCISSSGASA